MRYLSTIDIPAALRRGRSVEQFLGRSPEDSDCIRHVELRPAEGKVEVWVYDVEDLGSQERSDLYAFPYMEPEGPQAPVATFDDAMGAVSYASASLAADPSRWVNRGVVESEYGDYLRAGRPDPWST